MYTYYVCVYIHIRVCIYIYIIYICIYMYIYIYMYRQTKNLLGMWLVDTTLYHMILGYPLDLSFKNLCWPTQNQLKNYCSNQRSGHQIILLDLNKNDVYPNLTQVLEGTLFLHVFAWQNHCTLGYTVSGKNQLVQKSPLINHAPQQKRNQGVPYIYPFWTNPHHTVRCQYIGLYMKSLIYPMLSRHILLVSIGTGTCLPKQDRPV